MVVAQVVMKCFGERKLCDRFWRERRKAVIDRMALSSSIRLMKGREYAASSHEWANPTFLPFFVLDVPRYQLFSDIQHKVCAGTPNEAILG